MTDLEKYDKNILNAVLRQDFSSFISKVFSSINPGTTYHSNWHIDLISEHLEAVRRREIKRLIINMPPRALKSVCVSVAWPAWILGHHPEARILAASYSNMLSLKHSMDCRFVIESDWYKELFPTTILSKKHNQKSKFLTTCNGFRFATSVGGSATGEGGDVLIIDDPHNPTQINSTKLRSKAIDWFEQTFLSRLNDKANGAIILVMQRLHENDLTANLLPSNEWEHLEIPALASKRIIYKINNYKYQYEKGEILHEARDTLDSLNKLEEAMGVRNYAAQFLQKPMESNFSLLKKSDITFYDHLPRKIEFYVLSWDTAIKTNENADYSVLTCWAVADGKYYLINNLRKKMTYPDLKIQAEKSITKYNPRYVLIEDKASGQSLIQDLMILGYNNIKPIRPKLDKVTRFASVVPIFQSSSVQLPSKGSFMHTLLNEITNFPNSKHDDIVDSISQFLNFIKHNKKESLIQIRTL